MTNRVCYGYNVRPEGDLTVNESEAKVVYTDTVHLQKAMVIYGTQSKTVANWQRYSLRITMTPSFLPQYD